MKSSSLPLGLLAAALCLMTAVAAQLGVASAGISLAEKVYSSQLVCTLSAAADTYVRSDQSGSSFGIVTTLLVNNSSAATTRSLVRFDLAACSPAIPQGAIVRSAILQLTTASLLNVTQRTYELRRATGAWSESTTWSTQPSVAGTVTASALITSLTLSGTNVDWSVVGDVQGMVAGDLVNHGWRLADSVEGVTPLLSAQLSFNARESASSQPRLTVTYAP